MNTEIAANFKEQGNEYFKGRRFREALGFYTQGIDAKPGDGALAEALLCNRAACNLELRTSPSHPFTGAMPCSRKRRRHTDNFASTLRDCASAIRLNARCAKAYYRSAQALLALERADEAFDACERCLAFDAANAGVRALRDKAVRMRDEKERRAREKEEMRKMKVEEERRMKMALAVRFSFLYMIFR